MQLPYRIGRYTLLSKIANGGMAEIYLGRYDGAQGFSKPVAIKRILPSSTKDMQFTEALIDEAKALVQLPHQNIVQVYELGEDGAHLFISMEYVNGVDVGRVLKKLMQRGEIMPVKFVLYVIAQILQGLDFVHRVTGNDRKPLDLIHRDISPQNILCSWNGAVKLADFGIAKGSHRTAHTVVNQVKGKYAYMSPEQAMGAAIDQRTDLYAAGIVMFELLAGRRLYDGDSDLEVIEKVKMSRIPLEFIAHAPPELRHICAIALGRDRDDRYQTAAEFLHAVNQCAITLRRIAYGSDYGDYLRGLFPDDVQGAEERFAQLSKNLDQNVTRIMTPSSQGEDVRTHWLHLPSFKRGLMVSSLILMSVLLPAGTTQKPPPVTQVASEPVVLTQPVKKASAPPVSVSQPSLSQVIGGNDKPRHVQKAAKVVPPVKPVSTTGTISVSAQPWGVITIPGYIAGRESPVRGVRVKNGTHTVKVEYTPTGSVLTRRVKVAGGKRVRCYARFVPKASMSCR